MKLPLFMSLPVCAIALTVPMRAEEAGKAPIWKISDADSTVYLAGSVHLLREKDLPIPEAFDRVYAESEEVVFEIDMAAMSEPGTAAKMHQLGSLPAGETLADRFGPGTMKRLRAYLEDYGMKENFFDSYAPGMVFLLLSSFEATRLGAKPELGLESNFYAKTVADGKPSRGLETIAFQISRLNGMDKAKIEELINTSLDAVGESSETFDAIALAWRSGEAEDLAETIAKESTFTPELRRVLLTERNRNWIPEIEKALATDRDVMFLVGAAHLVGEESVIDLLQKKGLEVTQLANPE